MVKKQLNKTKLSQEFTTELDQTGLNPIMSSHDPPNLAPQPTHGSWHAIYRQQKTLFFLHSQTHKCTTVKMKSPQKAVDTPLFFFFVHYINIFNCFNRKNIKQFNFGILHLSSSSLQTHNIQYIILFFKKKKKQTAFSAGTHIRILIFLAGHLH